MQKTSEYEYGVKVYPHEVITISNRHGNSQYALYFHQDDIKGFDKANQADIQKFSLLISEPLSFAAQYNQAGIKDLSKCEVCVSFSVGNKMIKLPITHELKINRSAARVGLITLNPIDPQKPKLLVATVFMKDGLHGGKAKKYQKGAYSLSRHGLFKQINHHKENLNDLKKASPFHPTL